MTATNSLQSSAKSRLPFWSGLGQSLNTKMPHAEVILTFIFMNSLMASALDFQLSGGCSKLIFEGSQYQPIRKKLLLSKRRCEFRVLVTGGDAGIGRTERRLLLRGLLSGHNQKDGTVSHTSNLESLPALARNVGLVGSETMRSVNL